jgi:predicted AlkP superfamily pyrophosphatase or phosphodiesterase
VWQGRLTDIEPRAIVENPPIGGRPFVVDPGYTDDVSGHRFLVLLMVLSLAGTSCHAALAPPAPVGKAPGTAREVWLDQFARGYFPGRSGQLFLVPRERDFIVDRNPLYAFMHGSPWDYDTHVPLLFHGPPFIKQGVVNDAVTQQDVVPTLAALLGTAPPATAIGRPLQQALASTTARPRVVALFVLDGARADYFDTYADVLPTLSRLRREGTWFSHARVTSAPTLTSVGHANLGTGADPRIHGLVVNNLFNRVTGKPQEAYNGLDPGELMALTLADVWNIETEGRAIIIGQGGAIRATAGLVGHGACILNGRRVLAASYSTRDAGWETNPACYTMSEALKPLNARKYWEEVNGDWMGHDISDPTKFRHSAVFQRFEGDALAAVLEREPIGSDEVTDLVLVNLKGPDYVGHAYGPASAEMKAELTELDRQITRALSIIGRKAGEDHIVTTFVADHGMPGEPRPGGRHYMDDVSGLVDKRFSPSGGTVIQYYNDAANNEMHLDTEKLRTLGFSLKDVASFLESQGFFAAVYTEDDVRIAQSRIALRAQ